VVKLDCRTLKSLAFLIAACLCTPDLSYASDSSRLSGLFFANAVVGFAKMRLAPTGGSVYGTYDVEYIEGVLGGPLSFRRKHRYLRTARTDRFGWLRAAARLR